MNRNALHTYCVLALLLAGCGSATPIPTSPRTLTVMTHDSFAVSEEVVVEFQAQHSAIVKFLASGDAGTLVSHRGCVTTCI